MMRLGVRDDQPCAVSAGAGPLEGYAARFDDVFGSLTQRRGFREYLAGLLAPRAPNKTLTALAGAEPVTGAQHPAVQRLQFFLSESRWDPEENGPSGTCSGFLAPTQVLPCHGRSGISRSRLLWCAASSRGEA
jgi:hypothetical protein